MAIKQPGQLHLWPIYNGFHNSECWERNASNGQHVDSSTRQINLHEQRRAVEQVLQIRQEWASAAERANDGWWQMSEYSKTIWTDLEPRGPWHEAATPRAVVCCVRTLGSSKNINHMFNRELHTHVTARSPWFSVYVAAVRFCPLLKDVLMLVIHPAKKTRHLDSSFLWKSLC